MVNEEKEIVSVGRFKSEMEIMNLFREYDKETWSRVGDNYDIVETKNIFINGNEVQLSSNILLLDEAIVLCAPSPYQSSIIAKYLKRERISNIEFLDNSEEKGAVLIVKISSQMFWKKIMTFVTPETSKHLDYSYSSKVLTIPVMNSDKDSIRRIHKRLFKFCYGGNNKSPDITLTNITYSQFRVRILPFNLKPAIKISEDNGKKQCTISLKNHCSFQLSIVKSRRPSLSKDKSTNNNLDDSLFQHFSRVKDTSSFESCLESEIFQSQNIETDETYHVSGRAFSSLFGKNWLHCDVIDNYLNVWRKRLREGPSKNPCKNKGEIKIYDTLFYTRLTRRVALSSSKNLSKKSSKQLQMNAYTISREKVYTFSRSYYSIFDFDIHIFPIHVKNHWITGVIYQPKNCLVKIRKKNDYPSEEEKNFYTTIFIFDSMTSNSTLNNHFCCLALREYIEACYVSSKENIPGNDYHFDRSKIKIIKLENPYQQQNGYDCGLFMLEFIRQVLINPMSLEELIKRKPMAKVLPGFSVRLSRNYLKLFVYSMSDLKKWTTLYEMEQYYLIQCYGKQHIRHRSRSVQPKRTRNFPKISIRNKSCGA